MALDQPNPGSNRRKRTIVGIVAVISLAVLGYFIGKDMALRDNARDANQAAVVQ